MQKLAPAPAVVAFGFVISSYALGQDIHLKTRIITPIELTSDELAATIAASGKNAMVRAARGGSATVHQIVEFSHTPGVADLDALLAAGGEVTGVLPDNAVVIAVAGRLGRVPEGAIWIGEMEARDKISPALGVNAVLRSAAGAVVPVIVEFHSDVDTAHQNAVETALHLIFQRPEVLISKHVIVQATREVIEELAERDEVAYIFPADPELLTGAGAYPCIGMLTTAGAVAQYANITHGWDVGSDNIAHLSYFFGSMTPQVSAATVESEILRAFAQWSAKVNVTFSPAVAANLARTIAVEFVSGAHGDSYPFTATGGVLAHTFYPVPVNSEPIAGDMHFNADESWHVGSDTDIYTVALHEAGHALGLSHSDNPGDVMYPYYHRGLALSAGDIGAALELYPAAGAGVTSTTTSSTSSTSSTTSTSGSGSTSTGTTITTASTPTVTPLALTLNALAATTQAATIAIGGTVSGGVGHDSVEWQTDHGYSGSATVANAGTWSAANIPLVTGANTVTVTAFNSADQVATKTAAITMLKPCGVTVSPVTVSIASPVSAVTTVTAATISVSGTAAGGAGITEVTWQTSNGASGTASGTNTWIATGIPLPEGNTTIIVRAYDSTGANAWVATVAERP